MNIYINEILENDNELFNRVRAYGPGDGINRMGVVVEDQTSIDAYGVREITESYPEVVDLADLQARANAFLAKRKDPIQEISFTHYFNSYDLSSNRQDVQYNAQIVLYNGQPLHYSGIVASDEDNFHIKRGDTIRVASKELDIAWTGIVDELDWSLGQVDIRLGQPSFNLLDVIRGPIEDEERRRVALGLPTPIGVRAQRSSPGIILLANPYTNSRAAGVEIYASTSASFTPSNATLLKKSPGTRFEFPELESGVIYYFRVRSYDNQGNVSEFADPVSAISGHLSGDRIEDGTLGITPFASGIRPPRNVLNLPDVTAGGDWELGDLVVYDDGTNGPRLYKLESQTGDPNTDWIPVVNTDDLIGEITETQIADDSISTPKLQANSVVASKILAGTITANEIASNTITAGQIAAGAIGADEIAANAVTAGKILINGSVTVAQDGSQDGALRILNSGGTEILRLGAGISGKPGVPSGTDYGLWGSLGTGVFIEDAPRNIKADRFYSTASNGNVVTGGSIGSSSDVVLFTSLTIPSGFKAMFVVSPYGYNFQTSNNPSGTYQGGVPIVDDMINEFGIYWGSESSPSSTNTPILNSGTYSDVRIYHAGFVSTNYYFYVFSVLVFLVEA